MSMTIRIDQILIASSQRLEDYLPLIRTIPAANYLSQPLLRQITFTKQ